MLVEDLARADTISAKIVKITLVTVVTLTVIALQEAMAWINRWAFLESW
jgi:hypothetical protein